MLRSTYVKRCIFVILLLTVGGEIILDNALSQITNFVGTSNTVFRTKYLAVAEKQGEGVLVKLSIFRHYFISVRRDSSEI